VGELGDDEVARLLDHDPAESVLAEGRRQVGDGVEARLGLIMAGQAG